MRRDGIFLFFVFFFSSRRRHTRFDCDWSSDVCSSDLSCTNSRLDDLRAAAHFVAGKHVAKNIKQALIVPGSRGIKSQAEKEGLDKIFRDAGFEWRDAGCSMCIGMNADVLPPHERSASTSNRNFEGRQGKDSRTHLVSPVMAAAAAIAGHFVDVREFDVAQVE